MMMISEYQDSVSQMTLPTANNVEYGITNLAGEAGEVASLYAKALRDKWEFEDLQEKMKYELGDVLFMVNHLCNQFDLDILDVMSNNVEKLTTRKKNGTIQGSGDDR